MKQKKKKKKNETKEKKKKEKKKWRPNRGCYMLVFLYIFDHR